MNDPTLNLIFSSVSNLGFPIVVAGYLLLRFERKIEVLSEAISKLSSCSRCSECEKNK